MARRTPEELAIARQRENEAWALLRQGRSKWDIADEFGWTMAEVERVIARMAVMKSRKQDRLDENLIATLDAQAQWGASEAFRAWQQSLLPAEERETGRAALDRNGEVVNLPDIIRIKGQSGNPAHLSQALAFMEFRRKLAGLDKQKAEIDVNVNDPSAAAERVDSLLDRFAAAARERGLVGAPQGELPESTGEAGTPVQLAVLGTPEPIRAER